ncbi:MAG TPA: SLC13 family permease [Microlunatus sp.]|nr:SLC13 family permease [Microlunatus sp.]
MLHADLIERVLPILGFLVCVTIIAELSDRIGVFSYLAHHAARIARGSVPALWLLVVVLATAATAVLSLDTTAVLLTPVVLALAQRLNLSRHLFAFTTVWLANTASLFLPVSNLTNLLALHPLEAMGVRADALGFLTLTWPAAVVSWLVTVVVLAVVFRRSLRGRYVLGPPPRVRYRGLLVLGIVVCAALGPALLAGVEVLLAAAVGAAALVVGSLVVNRGLLDRRLLPWQLVLGVFVLFAVIQLALNLGLGRLLAELGGQGESWRALLRVAGLGAVASNLANNLPSYLALEVVAGTPIRMVALLVGVNSGPLITPWASLATVLWAGRCRAAGVSVDWRRFALLGVLLVVPLILLSVGALWVVGVAG